VQHQLVCYFAAEPHKNACCLRQRWQYHCLPCRHPEGRTSMRYSLYGVWARWRCVSSPLYNVKFGDASAESVHIPLKDVHNMRRMRCIYLDLLRHLSLHVGLKFVMFSDMSISRCLQDDDRSGGTPSLLPSTESRVLQKSSVCVLTVF
jgi:hypothetical protein